MLDLGPRGRTIACAIFFGAEAILVATAGMRSDRSYGFRMFPEASSITVHLSRRLDDGTLVPVEKGRWQARDCSGSPHLVVWAKMVRSPAPWRLDAPVGAPYGVESELHRTSDALRWVLDHTRDDCDTRAFVARVDARRNGRPPYEVDLEAARDGALNAVPDRPRDVTHDGTHDPTDDATRDVTHDVPRDVPPAVAPDVTHDVTHDD